MLHIPLLRRGEPYRSLDVSRTPHYRTGEPFVEISQANVGLIRRDLLRSGGIARGALAAFSTPRADRHLRARGRAFRRMTRCRSAIRAQSPQDYVEQLSATTGLPHVMVRRNMQKIRTAHGGDGDRCFDGLTRGLPLEVLDDGLRGGTQLLPASGHARRRAAEQFARRAFALAPGDRAEDRAGA